MLLTLSSLRTLITVTRIRVNKVQAIACFLTARNISDARNIYLPYEKLIIISCSRIPYGPMSYLFDDKNLVLSDMGKYNVVYWIQQNRLKLYWYDNFEISICFTVTNLIYATLFHKLPIKRSTFVTSCSFGVFLSGTGLVLPLNFQVRLGYVSAVHFIIGGHCEIEYVHYSRGIVVWLNGSELFIIVHSL